MKKLRKALSFCLIGGSLLISNQAVASSNWCDLDGCWELGVEALYWKPCICDWQYGFTKSDSRLSAGVDNHIFQDALTVATDYEWGFRILGGYLSHDCCRSLRLDWVYLRSKDSDHAAPNAFIRATPRNPSAPSPNTLTPNVQLPVAKLRLEYNRVNLRGAQYLHRGCNLDLYTYVGIRWINIEQTRHVAGLAFVGGAAVESPDDIFTRKGREKSKFDGAGLEFGLGGEYRTRCGLSLVGLVAPTVTLGERKHHLSANFTEVGFVSNYASRTHCTPGLDFRLGLSYTRECDCAIVVGELGYEMHYYFNTLATIDNWVEDTVEALQSRCINVGFGGPYASLKVRF